MASYVCTLSLNSADNSVVTSWVPQPPVENGKKDLTIDDSVTFTSTIGDWRVDFVDSPFNPAATPGTFSAPAGQARTAVLLRGNAVLYAFDCILIVNGQTFGYLDRGAGDDIRVKP